MNGSVKIYRGDSYLSAFSAALSAVGEAPAYVLAPDRFTLQAEKHILTHLNLRGTFNFGVYSFERLYYFLSGGAAVRNLPAVQGTMLLQRIISENQKNLVCFKKSASFHSFAAEIYALIMKMKACGITSEDLPAAGEGALPKKLADIALVMREYERETAGKYSDMSQRLRALAALIGAGALKGTALIVCGFDRLTALERRVLNAATQAGVPLYIALYDESELAAEVDKFSLNPEIIDAPASIKPFAERIKQGLFTAAAFSDAPPEGATVYQAEDKLSETERLAESIINKVRGGLKYSDIAVLLGDFAASAPVVARVFTEYGINFSLDAPRRLSEHPAAGYISAALSAARAPRRSDVFALVKSPCFRGSRNDKHIFENYVRKFGVDFGGFSEPFTAEDERLEPAERQKHLKAAETLRRELVRVLGLFRRGTGAGALALIREARADAAAGLDAAAPLPETREFLRLGFEALESVTAYMEEVFPTDTRPEVFLASFTAGCAAYEIKILPQYADSVTVGPIGSLRLAAPKAVYITDLCDKVLPPEVSDTDILSDRELKEMEGRGLSLLPTKRLSERNSRVEILSSFCAGEELHLLWAESDAAGKTRNPSPLLARLRVLFTGADGRCALRRGGRGEPGANAADELAAAFAPNERVAGQVLTEMAARLRDGSAADYAGIAGALYDTLSARGVITAEDLPPYRPPEEKIAAANELFFSGGTTAVSEIEDYYRCPYLHFARYGLQLSEREEQEMDPLKIGVFLHRAMELFVKRGMTGEEQIFDEVAADPTYAALAASESGKALSRRLRAEILRVCAEARRHQEYSLFLARPELTELEFSDKADLPPLKVRAGGRDLSLRGKIDRADVWESGGQKYARIIDYKTGKVEFSLSDAALGVKLQLPVYLAALEAAGYRAAGAFYFPVHNDPARDYKMKGFLCAEEGIPAAMDFRLAEPSAASDIIGVKTKKDGKVSGTYRFAMSAEDFRRFIGASVELVRRAARRIPEGEPHALPAKEACSYCPYFSLCLPDGESKRTHPYRMNSTEDFRRFLDDFAPAPAAESDSGRVAGREKEDAE